MSRGCGDVAGRLNATAAALEQARQQLRALRRRALAGGFDDRAFARIVVECRRAEAEVQRARQAHEAARQADYEAPVPAAAPAT